MLSETLRTIDTQLHSDKVTQRKEGYQAIHSTFASSDNVRSLNEDDYKWWLFIFQALFAAVRKEKDAFVSKKSGTPTLKRLSEAASTVRWLVEKGVLELKRKASQAVVKHLLQTMVHHHTLLEPVALDYAKALRALLSHQPHLDHLEEDTWNHILHLCFSLLLNDTLHADGQFDEEDEIDEDTSYSVKEEENNVMGVDSDDEVESSFRPKPSARSKRARSESDVRKRLRKASKLRDPSIKNVTPVQLEMAVLIQILLKNGGAPYLSSLRRHLPRAILHRFERFYSLYAPDVSIHHSILSGLNATITNLAMNNVHETSGFAYRIWEPLMNLWVSKDRTIKEEIIIALRSLLPFITSPNEGVNATENKSLAHELISRLARLLDAEADGRGRGGLEPLSQDSVRLQITLRSEELGVFQTSTLQSGFTFNEGHALTWAALELQADCLAMLIQSHIEIIGNEQGARPSKRQKFDDPVQAFFASIENLNHTPISRVYRFQALLFFVERHWSTLEETTKEKIFQLCNVKDRITNDDISVQYWAHLCQAAIAYAISPSSSLPTWDWNAAWIFAIRRTNVVGVSRAACHAAHAFLLSGLVSSPSATRGLETLVTEITVQGPSFPYDSVCAFLRYCAELVAQDMQLYKLRYEERVISWLVEIWSVVNGTTSGFNARSKHEAHTMDDILSLVAVLCGLPKIDKLVYGVMHPDSEVVQAILEARRATIIHEYILNARVPAPTSSPILAPPFSPSSSSTSNAGTALTETTADKLETDFQSPPGRAVKFSTFLDKSLRALLFEWESAKDLRSSATPEKIRRTLDIAILAVAFQATLHMNGFKHGRQTIQLAARLIHIVLPGLSWHRWKAEERLMMLASLDPLTFLNEDIDELRWEIMAEPDERSGIHRTKLLALRSPVGLKGKNSTLLDRRKLQVQLWDFYDMHQIYEEIRGVIYSCLYAAAGVEEPDNKIQHEDKEDYMFTIRRNSALEMPKPPTGHRELIPDPTVHRCISYITIGNQLQNSSQIPTQDSNLVQLLVRTSGDSWLAIGPAIFQSLAKGEYTFGVDEHGDIQFDQVLSALGEILRDYTYSRSEPMQLLLVSLLRSSMNLWVPYAAGIGSKIFELLSWLVGTLTQKKISSWRVRDHLVAFLDQYLQKDPDEAFWRFGIDELSQLESPPHTIDLDTIADYVKFTVTDDDSRVRFRSAIATSRLFLRRSYTYSELKQLYQSVMLDSAAPEPRFEHVLTDLLLNGNTMVLCSEIRRAPYVELLLKSVQGERVYDDYIEAILIAVAKRLGLENLADLGILYAFSISMQFIEAQEDMTRIPPALMGYSGRVAYLEAIYPHALPLHLQNEEASNSSDESSFLSTFLDGAPLPMHDVLANIFPMRVALRICSNFDTDDPFTDHHSEIMWNTVLSWAQSLPREHQKIEEILVAQVDSIVYHMVRTIGDLDPSPTGPLALAIATHFPGSQEPFYALTQFRTIDNLVTHRPSAPLYTSQAVLHGIRWLSALVADTFAYQTLSHTLHRLFSNIGSCALVNEQLRLLNAVCVLVAIRKDDFYQYSSLLRGLMFNATIILGQPDLSRRAQSILDWAFDVYSVKMASLKGPDDDRFPEIISRIARTAFNFAQHLDDRIRDAGDELMNWIEDVAGRLFTVTGIHAQILEALPLWPRHPRGRLGEVVSNPDYSQLASILRNPRFSSNKFRLTRRFHHSHQNEAFPKLDFWYLKACVPSVSHMDDDDVNAFADILLTHAGSIHPMTNVADDTIGARHQKASHGANDVFHVVAAYEAVLVSLLDMIYCDDMGKVHVAYDSLRRLLGLRAVSEFAWETARDEVKIFAHSPLPLRHARPFTLDGFQKADSEFVSGSRYFGTWVTQISRILCHILGSSDQFYAQLDPVIEDDLRFAIEIFPVVVHEILRRALLAKMHSVREVLSAFFSRILLFEDAAVTSVQIIVDTILHLRNFRPPMISNPLGHDLWLDVNYSLLARAATRSGAFTTALLFIELAAEYRGDDADILHAQEEQSIMFDIYGHIQEPDGFYGIKSQNPYDFLLRRLHHEKQWGKALQFHGAQYESQAAGISSVSGVVNSLYSSGLGRLAAVVHQSLNPDEGSVSWTDYQLGWRTEEWDLPPANLKLHPSASVFTALRAVHRERDSSRADRTIRVTLRREIANLHSIGNENMTELQHSIQRLLCLREVSVWNDQILRVSSAPRDTFQFRPLPGALPFADREAIVATRISLLRSMMSSDKPGNTIAAMSQGKKHLLNAKKACLLDLSENARMSGFPQIALNAIVKAQALELEFDGAHSFDTSWEFARVLWEQKEQKMAVEFLESLLLQHPSISQTTKALVLSLLGEWIAEACLRPPAVIRGQYFEEARKLLDTNQSSTTRGLANIPYRFALFAEHQYRSASRFDITPIQEAKEAKSKRLAMLLSALGPRPSSDEKRQTEREELKIAQDEQKIATHQKNLSYFLHDAITMFSRCLELSDEHDVDAVIRLCSLWFGNFDNEELNEYIKPCIDTIPSRKFIFLAHQLTARLSSAPSSGSSLSSSQLALQALILRLCVEHPFHSLYQMYAMSQGYLPPARRQSGLDNEPQAHQRRNATRALLDRVRTQTKDGRPLRDIERLCEAYLEWAERPAKDTGQSSQPQSVPSSVKLLKIKAETIPVSTIHLPVDLSCRYKQIIGIKGYSSKYATSGGLHVPKISDCIGTDGRRYKQLFKGQDDLRQDAIMEQVFELANLVLMKDAETRQRELSIRTYKVIPLTNQAGMLEFVQNTTTLAKWLIPAHRAYYPKDIGLNEAGKVLFAARTKPVTPSVITRIQRKFIELREQFHPVFRHFFQQKHKAPMSWFQMRLKYARSAATTSIIGHILGIGDRHLSNILIDEASGELVHIDFGITFEQGRLLPVPETVPFRLTADMVDGLGTSGTEGVFRKCSEETLRVMRDGSEVINTILEVFKYDPLHSWTADPIKLKQKQRGSELDGADEDDSDAQSAVDRSAEQALRTVREKLDKSLSVEYTVNDLIASATDPANLALIFHGWAPQA